MGFFRRSVLAFRVLLWVLLASFALFALATAIGFFQERTKAVEAARLEAQREVEQSLPAMANSLWQFDVTGLNALLAGLVASPVIVHAEIVGSHETVAEASQGSFKGTADRVWTVQLMAPDQKTPAGTLRISESYASVQAQIANTLHLLILTDLLKIIGMALVLFAIVYSMVARHLRRLARDVARLGSPDTFTRLSVDRRKLGNYRDEIDILVDAFNRFLAERSEEMRKRSEAEQALARSEENLAITLHSIGDGVIATDAAGRITRMNPTAERLTGWVLQDAQQRLLTEVFHIVNATTREPVVDPVLKVMAYGQVVGLANHTVLLSRDGKEYQIADSAAPIRNATNEIVGVVLVFSDVTEKYAAEAALEESRERHRALSEGAFEAIFISENSICLEQNSQAERMFGFTLEEAKGRASADWVVPEDRDMVRKYVKAGYQLPYEARCLRKDGSSFPAVIHARMMHYRERDVRVTAVRDVTEQKQAEEDLRIAATAFESQQGMFIVNARRLILRVNKAFTSITGYSAQEAVGQSPRFLASDRHDRAFYSVIIKTLQVEGAWTGEIWKKRKNGEVYPEWQSISTVKDKAGATTHYVVVFSDVSERVRAQVQIDTLAFYDPLTKLPNRRLLLDRLDQTLHASTRHARKSALLFVDLDNFRTLNDTLGHHQGDQLLSQVAERLRTCIREGDTLARLGSDEFVVMLENLSEDEIEAATQAEAVGDKILETFALDFQLDTAPYHGTSSIGITLFGSKTPEGNEQPLKRAELAMFQAKAAGRNAVRFFEARMQAQVSARAELEADLREAVQKNQFVLHYQPQVVGAGRIVGVEALVRWEHPQRGMVSPAEFIPLAEETGLILPLGQWVLETACRQLATWASDPDLAHINMAVNVSARQFRQAGFVDSILSTLAKTHASPRLLKLELTESMLIDNVEEIIGNMGALKSRGVGFSLDDFGTGYSSLSYLKRLPLDQLKIDQGFIRNVVTDPNDAAIAKMVIVLAESLGLAVIAEGVELQAQVDFLAHHGCHVCQGYFFSKPLPLAAFEAFARKSLAQA